MKRLIRILDRASIALAAGCLLGTAGAMFWRYGVSVPMIWAAIAWCVVLLSTVLRKQVEAAVLWCSKLLGLSDGAFEPLERTAPGFAREFTRFYYAARALRVDAHDGPRDLGANLRRIAKGVYQELSATAVEFALFDEVSQQWSQALVIGAPRTINSQGMLGDSASNRERQVLTFDTHQVIVMPVVLSGNVFGAIRVEMESGRKPVRADLELLEMFALQGALALVDAQFTSELLRLRRASEETVRAKTGFLANLSHELRGPLGIILNGVELIKDGLCGPVTEQQQSTLRMIKESGDHLLDLVNDVLDYAKVEAGKVKPKTVELVLGEILEDLVAVVRSQAIEKGHQLQLLPVTETLGVTCDKRHFRQMMINLLTNAIKYTPSGGEILVSAQRIPGGKARIEVRDTGIGIPPDQQAKVFAAFERVEDQYALAQGGTGLGMPLTRRLGELNGGQVDFESAPGTGSTFWILLPAVELQERVETDNAVDGTTRARGPSGRGEIILIVDHDRATREMLATYLRAEGFEIVQAASGSEVLRSFREHRVELAIVENDMPDLPGEDMVTAIRSTPYAGSVPLVLLSARAFVFDIERFLKLGVDRCLSKPVNLSEVAATSRRLIDEARSTTLPVVSAVSEAEAETKGLPGTP